VSLGRGWGLAGRGCGALPFALERGGKRKEKEKDASIHFNNDNANKGHLPPRAPLPHGEKKKEKKRPRTLMKTLKKPDIRPKTRGGTYIGKRRKRFLSPTEEKKGKTRGQELHELPLILHCLCEGGRKGGRETS